MNIQNFLNIVDSFCETQETKQNDNEQKKCIKNIRNVINLRNINNDINNNNKIISNIIGNNGISNIMSFFITNYINNNDDDVDVDDDDEVRNFRYFCECDEEIQKNRTDCVICIENIKDFDKVIVTECKHVFHVDCITTWLNNTKTCPTCRNEIMLD